MISRVIWIVLDSVGIGAMDDACMYGDENSDTIGNISKKLGGLNIPNMVKIGLGNIDGIHGLKKCDNPIGVFGKLKEKSIGKDTVTGHFEMSGIVSEVPFKTYPNGFKKEIIEKFEKETGRKVLGNKPASGTAILDELGEESIKTGSVIVYTSADSVFQIAANEDVVPLDELYKICKFTRKMMTGENLVARVIARPFIGNKSGHFTRTPNRRDFAIKPPYDTILDKAKNKGLDVIAVGKIEDIFSKKGITEAVHTIDNMDGVDKTIEFMKKDNKGIIYTNLVDFDMKWGHRNNYKAYGKGLEDFDLRLKEIMSSMRDDDILFITADHGCDPTTEGTDHSREYVPFIGYGKELKENVNLHVRDTFADIGQTIAEVLNTEKIKNGTGFYKEIKR
ncbi:phosphopentomutase [Clostridium sp. BJN0001]|uniref:phosphopentomutase n=1 Tax=Clostridium sp. BJN0001 TaxID=2930219 RepID=UPI001FD391D5|nr:phosphopentomutase [Clostridium sp. BJN0001]